MSRAEIQSWLRSFYDARRRNDAAGCAALFAWTASMRIVASGGLGGLGDLHQGMQALQTVARALCAEWNFSEMIPDMILIDGSRAAVRNAGLLRHVPTGRKESFALMDVFHFEDGQCISLEEYADTWAILNLSNPRRSGRRYVGRDAGRQDSSRLVCRFPCLLRSPPCPAPEGHAEGALV